MAEGARIESIDVLRSFRAALWKFAETASGALGDAESDLNKTLMWLENEQQTYWQHQMRARSEAVTAAKDKVRQKKLFKDATGRQQSAVDEEKALAIAQRRLAEAEQKLAATKSWSRRLQREMHNYKGGVQRLATMVMVDVPNAVATLDRLAGSLDKYVAAGPAQATSTAAPIAAAGAAPPVDAADSMARAEPEAPMPVPDPVQQVPPEPERAGDAEASPQGTPGDADTEAAGRSPGPA